MKIRAELRMQIYDSLPPQHRQSVATSNYGMGSGFTDAVAQAVRDSQMRSPSAWRRLEEISRQTKKRFIP